MRTAVRRGIIWTGGHLVLRKLIKLAAAVGTAMLVLSLIYGAIWWFWLPHHPTPIERAMLTAARSGEFGDPVANNRYTGIIMCHLYKANGFHGADIYYCEIGETNNWWQWETGALLGDRLHTHYTDPKEIPEVAPPDAVPVP
jgi:hypothetical protein